MDLLVPGTSRWLGRGEAVQGQFQSRLLHRGPPRKPRGEIRYTLRAVLTDGREVTSATSVRYVDGCPPPAVHTTLAAGPTGRLGFQATTPSMSEFLHGIKPAATRLIRGDLGLPAAQIERSPAVVLVHGSGEVGPREDRWVEELRHAGVATFLHRQLHRPRHCLKLGGSVAARQPGDDRGSLSGPGAAGHTPSDRSGTDLRDGVLSGFDGPAPTRSLRPTPGPTTSSIVRVTRRRATTPASRMPADAPGRSAAKVTS